MFRSRCSSPNIQDVIADFIHANTSIDLSKDNGSVAAHFAGVAIHHFEVGADVFGKIDLVDHSKSDCVIPGPPLRGILSPPLTSIT